MSCVRCDWSSVTTATAGILTGRTVVKVVAAYRWWLMLSQLCTTEVDSTSPGKGQLLFIIQLKSIQRLKACTTAQLHPLFSTYISTNTSGVSARHHVSNFFFFFFLKQQFSHKFLESEHLGYSFLLFLLSVWCVWFKGFAC